MKKNNIKLYNLIFPIWLLWLFPITWLVVLPANFLIDLMVVAVTLKYLKIQEIRQNMKAVIFSVWMFGFAADFIGTAAMLLSNIISFNYETQLGKWWYTNITNAVSYNPFESIYAVLWVSGCVILTAFLIYLFNYKYCLNKTNLDNTQKKKLALSLAVFTAPYLFYIPTVWFF
ncbi:hypothetical protein EDD70_1703 [Hydrogenoanaerobacterium saccharovorans]|uniref:Uncharacterized protein n=1 Tax=Hydrogenoanaerobacterium saccharovorans TaxID=474960 RepID=A0A1H7Z2D1_9FIRM|nr:hypothetical protein [Hydrogenoanaerobacterium saccharovorans]RPF48870.1 hypothetical protein EDD70_1703 [Hydrogenoanaerobacterium saccharovorans]SEM52385.1 hypothetical protein SAMN05216180_0393 [Hydrogenoanaerobacterium saccharovorans]